MRDDAGVSSGTAPGLQGGPGSSTAHLQGDGTPHVAQGYSMQGADFSAAASAEAPGSAPGTGVASGVPPLATAARGEVETPPPEVAEIATDSLGKEYNMRDPFDRLHFLLDGYHEKPPGRPGGGQGSQGGQGGQGGQGEETTGGDVDETGGDANSWSAPHAEGGPSHPPGAPWAVRIFRHERFRGSAMHCCIDAGMTCPILVETRGPERR